MFACCGGKLRDDEEPGCDTPPLTAPLSPAAYDGDRDTAGAPHGVGGAYFQDKSTYRGAWVNGNMEGEGERRGIDHSVYKGQFKQGWFHGFGVLEAVTGAKYSGEWKEGLKHGTGRFEYSDGSSYDGEWVAGERHGDGLYLESNGTRFNGAWVRDKPNGVCHWKSESLSLEGEWHGRDSERENDAEVSLRYTPELLNRWNSDHKTVSHMPCRCLDEDQWSEYFARPSFRYDGTAERIDLRLVRLLESENMCKEEEGVVIGKHLTELLNGGVHPIGCALQDFCRLFGEAYLPQEGVPFPGADVQLPRAISDLRYFIVAMRNFMLENMTCYLDTKQRKRHAHSVLVDVVYPRVFDTVWTMYCHVWAAKDDLIARRVAPVASLAHAEVMARLGIKSFLRLGPEQEEGIATVVAPEAGRAPLDAGVSRGDEESIAQKSDDVLLLPSSPVSEQRTYSGPYAKAVAVLRRLPDYDSPTAKIECLKLCSDTILRCIETFPRDESLQVTLGAEDKFPVVLFVLIQAKVPHIAAECALMTDALDERTKQVSEAGYRVTELQAALDHLCAMPEGHASVEASAEEIHSDPRDTPTSPSNISLQLQAPDASA